MVATLVIGLLIVVAPHDARCLVLLARNWFELHADIDVFRRDAFVDTKGKAISRRVSIGLREDISMVGRCAIYCHDPDAGLALASQRSRKPSWRLPRFVSIEINRLRPGSQSSAQYCTNTESKLHESHGLFSF